MTWVVRIAVLLLASLAAVQVHRIRGRLAHGDSDPAAAQRLAAGLRSVPLELDGGAYVGKPYTIAPDMVRMAGADVYTTQEYEDREGHHFQLYIGGSIANEENFHAPSYCMPAAGWEILEDSTVPFRAYPAQEGATMHRLLLQHGADRMLVYYWFQAGGEVADHEWTIRLARFRDLLSGAPLRPTVIVTVYTPVRRDIVAAETAVAGFLRAVGPHVHAGIVAEEN